MHYTSLTTTLIGLLITASVLSPVIAMATTIRIYNYSGDPLTIHHPAAIHSPNRDLSSPDQESFLEWQIPPAAQETWWQLLSRGEYSLILYQDSVGHLALYVMQNHGTALNTRAEQEGRYYPVVPHSTFTATMSNTPSNKLLLEPMAEPGQTTVRRTRRRLLFAQQ